jgi:hypothetical protein
LDICELLSELLVVFQVFPFLLLIGQRQGIHIGIDEGLNVVNFGLLN